MIIDKVSISNYSRNSEFRTSNSVKDQSIQPGKISFGEFQRYALHEKKSIVYMQQKKITMWLDCIDRNAYKIHYKLLLL